MNRRIWKKEQAVVANYSKRCDDRELTLMTATMSFVGYFILLDTSNDDDLTKQTNAEVKVSQISTEVAAFLYPYRLGNKQPLVDGIQASTLPFMNQAAKDYLIGQLSV